MAKFLNYRRADRQPVTLDSVTKSITALDNTLPLADTTSAFPGRSRNLGAVFLGAEYMLYRAAANTIRLSKRTAGVWADVVGFAAFAPGSGTATPVGLFVIRGWLIAVFSRNASAGVDGIIIRRSTDGATWTSDLVQANPGGSQPGPSYAAHAITWRNALWIGTFPGLIYYDPSTNTFAAGGFDTGDDAGITGEKVTHGCFARWNSDLYFLLPTTSALQSPKLYRLASTWTTATPGTAPVWTKQVLSIPTAGALTLGADRNNYALFVSVQNALIAWFSGADQTRVVKFTLSTTGLVATDITTSTLDSTMRVKVDVGWSIMSDDRRRTAERISIVGRDIAASPQAVLLLTWDGVGQATLDATFPSTDLCLVSDERSDFRLFTDKQPAAHITGFTTPFDGRTVFNYVLQDTLSRDCDITGEYSLDTQTWLPMTQGDGDSGRTNLTSSPAGVAHTFNWDAYQDFQGVIQHVDVRLVPRVSGP